MMDASQVQPAAEAIFFRFATRTFRVFGASYLAPPDLFQQPKQKIHLLDVCTFQQLQRAAASVVRLFVALKSSAMVGSTPHGPADPLSEQPPLPVGFAQAMLPNAESMEPLT